MAREQLTVTAPHAALELFASRQALVGALAGEIAERLAAAVARRGSAFIAVSGGSTPGHLFDALSGAEIDWKNVVVTLVDERLVPADHERSNERLVRSRLLKGNAANATFVGLYTGASDARSAADAASAGLFAQPWPLDVAVLGMGGDGHTASFFPDARALDRLLDPRNASLVEAVEAPSAGEPRLTLTLARLIEAPLLLLHIEGAEKRRVLEAALADGSDLPITAVMRAASTPMQVFWAP